MNFVKLVSVTVSVNGIVVELEISDSFSCLN